jgi:hypothetical protein
MVQLKGLGKLTKIVPIVNLLFSPVKLICINPFLHYYSWLCLGTPVILFFSLFVYCIKQSGYLIDPTPNKCEVPWWDVGYVICLPYTARLRLDYPKISYCTLLFVHRVNEICLKWESLCYVIMFVIGNNMSLVLWVNRGVVPPFLTFALDGGEWSAPSPPPHTHTHTHFTPKETEHMCCCLITEVKQHRKCQHLDVWLLVFVYTRGASMVSSWLWAGRLSGHCLGPSRGKVFLLPPQMGSGAHPTSCPGGLFLKEQSGRPQSWPLTSNLCRSGSIHPFLRGIVLN